LRIELPENFASSGSASLGITLIETISKQLAADYNFESSKKGTVFKLSFEKAYRKGTSSSFYHF